MQKEYFHLTLFLSKINTVLYYAKSKEISHLYQFLVSYIPSTYVF